MSLNNVTKVNQECNSSEENKPIVYWDGKHFASKDKSSLADIPLYTHPHKEQEPDLYSEDGFPLWTSPQFKELTDEEIDDVAKNNFEGVGRLIYMIAGNIKGDDFRQAVRSFARAIEERHGIK